METWIFAEASASFGGGQGGPFIMYQATLKFTGLQQIALSFSVLFPSENEQQGSNYFSLLKMLHTFFLKGCVFKYGLPFLSKIFSF